MRFLSFTLLIAFSFPIFGNYSYFHFQDKNIHLEDSTFRRYIRPQVRSIVSEYYHLLKKKHSLLGEMVQVKNYILTMLVDWEEEKDICPAKLDSCHERVRTFFHTARKLQIKLNQIHGLGFKDLLQKNKERDIESALSLQKTIDDISIRNYKLLHYLEELLITVDTDHAPNRFHRQKIRPLLNEMLVLGEIGITSLLPSPFRQDFDFIFTNYMKLLEKYVILNRDKKYLINNLEQLNIAWNGFHMKMTKGNTKLDRSYLQIISIMHNRWNSVLKLIMMSYRP